MISTKLNIILKNTLLVFCSLLIALIIAELIARFFVDDSTNRGAINNIYKFHEFDSKLGWKNKSNYSGTFEREEFKYNVSTNSEGMRYKEIQKDRLNNKKRIAGMGDSFTWGVGVKDSDRFTDIVENKSNEKYEVLNFGVSGYGPLRYLIQLDKVLEFNPDIVLLTFCLGNDFVDNVFFNRYGYYGPFTILDNKPEIEIYGYPIPKVGEFHDYLGTSYPFLNSFLEKSKLYYLINLFIRKLNTEKIGSNFKYTNQQGHSQSGHLGADENQKDIYVPNHSNDAKLFGLDLAVVNKKILSKISDRLAEQNVKFSIVVAPTKCEYNQCLPSSLKEQDNKGNNNNARNLLLNDLRELGIHYIDSTDSINLNDFWEIDSHWKPSGHVKISNDILKWLSNK